MARIRARNSRTENETDPGERCRGTICDTAEGSTRIYRTPRERKDRKERSPIARGGTNKWKMKGEKLCQTKNQGQRARQRLAQTKAKTASRQRIARPAP